MENRFIDLICFLKNTGLNYYYFRILSISIISILSAGQKSPLLKIKYFYLLLAATLTVVLILVFNSRDFDKSIGSISS